MTAGAMLRIFVLEGQRHQGELLYLWLLHHARDMGITGGAAFREVAGYGQHDRLHDHSFFELAGDQPVEVIVAASDAEITRFLAFLAGEAPSLFYIKSPCEFGRTGE